MGWVYVEMYRQMNDAKVIVDQLWLNTRRCDGEGRFIIEGVTDTMKTRMWSNNYLVGKIFGQKRRLLSKMKVLSRGREREIDRQVDRQIDRQIEIERERETKSRFEAIQEEIVETISQFGDCSHEVVRNKRYKEMGVIATELVAPK